MEQVFRITPLKDPKIVWSIDNSKTAFSAIGFLGNRWDMWDISACDFELNEVTGNQAYLGNKASPFIHIGNAFDLDILLAFFVHWADRMVGHTAG